MFDKSTYINRRKALKTKGLTGIALILGNVEAPMNYRDNTYHFRQDSNFLYFFGLDFPGLAGVVDFDSGEDFIFGNDVDIEDIIWMGPQVTLQENAAKAGITNTAPFVKVFDLVKAAKNAGRKVHFLPPYRAENKLLLENLLETSAQSINTHASLDLIKAIILLREVKEAQEVEEIKKACATGYQMHVAAMKMALPGNWEQKIAGTIEGIALAGGGMTSFPIILSMNGETLHNHDHSQILQEGRLMLCDAGAESLLHYASDFTRTTPVGGKFTQKQREIYEIVLAANNTATALSKPGVTYLSVHLAACEVLAAGLKDLGLMKGDVKEAVKNGAHAMFLPHGLGHMMGLDVHDMEDLGQIHVGYDDEIRPVDQFGTAYLRMGKRLKPGYVITNEPGCYFIPALIDKWQAEGINKDFINFDKVNEYRDFGGIRLEDDILITENGAEIIGERVPITPEEVEAVVAKG
ncbi:aminopeptidase P family protein [Maribellus sp. CM-23]|uniref:aminopeptidase P family protein n=1 Tax=Maribellus sp. CM-23 TaxID=2781026 RepID=UPI001F47E95B|nr:aminopeptidase P family protein [Maribellus sp. CM-23]MCE4566597.1 aminopeptidase P family protein [Maribellus sp. CM-23]